MEKIKKIKRNRLQTMSYSERLFQILNYCILTFLAISTIYPLWYTVVMSFSSIAEASSGGYHLYVKQISLQAYEILFKDKLLWYSYFNTIFRTVIGTLTSVIVTAMFAYPLSRKNMVLKKTFTTYMIIVMLFSGGMIPTYLVIKNLGLLNNRFVYILPGLMSAYNAIIMRNYFARLPEALVESAKIDGASEWRIFWKIIIPLSMPVLATVALWNAVGHWNSWFDSMLYFTDRTKQVVQLYLQRIVDSGVVEVGNQENINFTPETVKAATIVITIAPILMVYPFVQKYFVKGITLGSVKE